MKASVVESFLVSFYKNVIMILRTVDGHGWFSLSELHDFFSKNWETSMFIFDQL